MRRRSTLAPECLSQDLGTRTIDVARRRQQGDAGSLGKAAKLLHRNGRRRRLQLLQVAPAKLVKALGPVPVPFAQLGARGHLPGPEVQVEALLRNPPWPQAVDEHPGPAVRFRTLVHPFHLDPHDVAPSDAHRRTPSSSMSSTLRTLRHWNALGSRAACSSSPSPSAIRIEARAFGGRSTSSSSSTASPIHSRSTLRLAETLAEKASRTGPWLPTVAHRSASTWTWAGSPARSSIARAKACSRSTPPDAPPRVWKTASRPAASSSSNATRSSSLLPK